MKEIAKTRDQWRTYLQEAHGNTKEAMLEECKRMHEYQKSCNGKKGGSEFAKTVKEWCGYSQPTAAKMSAVGRDELLIHVMNKLPESYATCYAITTLSPEQRETLPLSPSLTLPQVKNWKEYGQLKAPKPDTTLEVIESDNEVEDAAMLVPPLEDWGLTSLGKRAMEQDRKKIQELLGQVAKSQSKKFVEAIIQVFKYHQSVFKRELERQIPDAMKARQKALDERERRLNLREKGIHGGINGESRKLILNVLHPDRAPEGMKEKYTKAFQVFKEVSG